MVTVSELKTLHLSLWEQFSKKSFIIQFITVIFLVYYCQYAVFQFSPKIIFTIVGALIMLPFLFARPSYGILVIAFITVSFIDYTKLPLIPFWGIGSLNLTDAILAMLFLYIIGRKLYYKYFFHSNYVIVRTPMDVPLLLFLLAVVIALINGIVIQGARFNMAFRNFREMIYYVMFFTLTNLLENKRDLRRFIWGFFFLALLASGINVVQQFAGRFLPLIFGRVEYLATKGFGEYTGVVRSLPPGLHAMYVSLIALFCLITIGEIKKNRFYLYLQIFILSLGILFAFLRNYFITIALSIFLSFSVATIKQKARIISYTLLITWILIIVLLYANSTSSTNKFTRIVIGAQERIYSLKKVTAIKGGAADTLGGRYKQTEMAFKKFLEYPIFGIGLATSYTKSWGVGQGDIWTLREMSMSGAAKKSWFGIHNSIFNLAARLGLVGFIPFVWVSTLFLMRGFRNWKKIKDPFFMAICIGFTVAYVGTLVSGLIDPILDNWRGIIPISIMWGTNEAIYRLEGIEGQNT